MEQIIEGVRQKYIDQVLEEDKDLFKGAEDIHWSSHLKLQGELQKHIDSSISKTINCPNETTVSEVKEMYELAYELGCKGVTIYRDGSRAECVLSSTSSGEVEGGDLGGTDEGDGEATWPPELYKIDLPDVAPAKRYRVSVDGQKVYINVTEDEDGQPLEVFTKFAYESDPVWNTLCRQLSLSLRYGIPLVDIIKQLDKSVVGVGDMSAKIARVLKRYLPESGMKPEDFSSEVLKAAKDKSIGPVKVSSEDLCPTCGSKMIHQGGCLDCPSCGWSKCS